MNSGHTHNSIKWYVVYKLSTAMSNYLKFAFKNIRIVFQKSHRTFINNFIQFITTSKHIDFYRIFMPIGKTISQSHLFYTHNILIHYECKFYLKKDETAIKWEMRIWQTTKSVVSKGSFCWKWLLDCFYLLNESVYARTLERFHAMDASALCHNYRYENSLF